jgi:hypothetical protein
MTTVALPTGFAKYTEGDVRRHPELLAFAVTYARDYYGDFEYLIAARHLVAATGTLPVSIAKGVLNCARTDPKAVAELPIGPDMRTEEYERPRLHVVGNDMQSPPRITARGIPVLSPTLRVPLKAKKRFVVSNHRQARLAHIFDGERSYGLWQRASGNIVPFVRVMCGIHLSPDNMQMVTDTDRALCASCVVIEGQGHVGRG